MIIKFKTTTETEKEINFPYFTRSEYGTMFGHYAEDQCIMISSARDQINILKGADGFDCPEVNQWEFELQFNITMTNILSIQNNQI